jgi:hypothetical protein
MSFEIRLEFQKIQQQQKNILTYYLLSIFSKFAKKNQTERHYIYLFFQYVLQIFPL